MFSSIKGRIFTVFFVLIISAIVILTALYTQLKKGFEDIIIQNSLEVSRLNADNLGNRLEISRQILDGLIQQDEVKQGNKEFILRQLAIIHDIDPELYTNCFHFDRFGNVTTFENKKTTISDRPYFKKLKEGETGYVLSKPVLGRVSGSMVTALVVPIISESGEFEGGLGISFDLARPATVKAATNFTESSFKWLVDATGTILSHPVREYIGEINILEVTDPEYSDFSYIAEGMLLNDSGFGTFFDVSSGLEKIITYALVPNSRGWKLAFTTPTNDLFSKMKSELIKSVFISLLVLLIIAYSIQNILALTTKPLDELIRAVSRNPNDYSPILIKSKDKKFNELVESYNRMIKSIAEYTHNLESLVEKRTEELNRANEKLNHENTILHDAANTDQLTGLFNRKKINDYLNYQIDQIKNHHIGSLSLLFLDLDNFKYYNDTFGHQIGDYLLKHIAGIFRSTTRGDDFIARYGGDEFIMIFYDISESDTDHIRSSILNEFSNLDGAVELLYQWTGRSHVIPEDKKLYVSIGTAIRGIDSDQSADDFIKMADEGMYKIKQLHKKGKSSR